MSVEPMNPALLGQMTEEGQMVTMPGGMPGMTVTRKREELTPEIVERLKLALQTMGLPPDIFKWKWDKDTFVFRPLLGKDWAEVQAFIAAHEGRLTQEEVDQKICEKAVIWPLDMNNPVYWDVQRAGYQSSLAKQIMARSGFFDPDLDQSSYLSVETLVQGEVDARPSETVIAELKAKFPNWPLKLVRVGTKHYITRPIARGEWKQATGNGEGVDLDLVAATRGTVWSASYPEAPSFVDTVAGTIRALAQVVFHASGFFIEPEVEEL